MNFMALALMIFSTSLFSAEIKVLEIPLSVSKPSSVSSVFNYNENLGRAWVEVTIEENFNSDEYETGDTYRAKVEGLSFDKASRSINLDIEGQIVDCAVIKSRGISVFRQNYLKNTNCSFTSKVVTVSFDNGYEIEKKRKLQVFLITK